MKVLNYLKKSNWATKLIFAGAIAVLLFAIFRPKDIHIQSPIAIARQMGGYVEHMVDDEQSAVKNAMSDNKPCFAMYYAPWCGYCKKTMPSWDQLASTYRKCKVVKVNCDVHKDLAKKHGVKSYPTIKYHPYGFGRTV